MLSNNDALVTKNETVAIQPKIAINTNNNIVEVRNQNIQRRSSALSLKSLNQKLQDQDKSKDSEIDLSNKPKTLFTSQKLKEVWDLYKEKLNQQHDFNMYAILNTGLPQIKENMLLFNLPNKLMADQLLNIKPHLLNFLRTQLNNYAIQFNVQIVEMETKKYVYTPLEKFNRLLEMNPELKILKDTFNLDL